MVLIWYFNIEKTFSDPSVFLVHKVLTLKVADSFFFLVQTTRDVYLNCFIYLEYIICKILSINLISWRWNGYNIRNVHTSFFWGHKVHTSRNIIKLFYMPMIYFLYCYFRFHFLVHNVLALTVADSLFVWFIQPYTNN